MVLHGPAEGVQRFIERSRCDGALVVTAIERLYLPTADLRPRRTKGQCGPRGERGEQPMHVDAEMDRTRGQRTEWQPRSRRGRSGCLAAFLRFDWPDSDIAIAIACLRLFTFLPSRF